MDEGSERADIRRSRLADAVREAKNRAADRGDVVLELGEAARARLELLAAELAPVFAEVPAEMDCFDLAISSGLQPRLWIDAVAHVALARDQRTFRFVRDTRSGRVTLAEGTAVAAIAEAVTDYIAERIVERERALAGGPGKTAVAGTEGAVAKEEAAPPAVVAEPSRSSGFLGAFAVLAFGALFGLGLAAAVFWDRLFPDGLNW